MQGRYARPEQFVNYVISNGCRRHPPSRRYCGTLNPPTLPVPLPGTRYRIGNKPLKDRNIKIGQLLEVEA